MKFIKTIKILFAALLVLCACSGEDRTHEYLTLTQHNNWIMEAMKSNYLWADSIVTPEERKFFGDPSVFLRNITTKIKGEKWSYVMVDTIVSDPHERGYFNHNESYGMDYMLITDPTGQTTRQYVRVVSVFDKSQAQKAGLQRGDFIVSYNGYKFSSSNINKLKKGPELKLTVCHLGVNVEDNTYFWKDTLEYVLPASNNGNYAYQVNDVVPDGCYIYSIGDTKVGYYNVTELIGENTLRSNSYPVEQYSSIFKNAGVNELVLDLRLCNRGNIDMAQKLASSIVKTEYRNRIFAKTIWNGNNSALNKDYRFDADVVNLGLNRVFIITSGYTQGAAEWVIHSLQAVMGKENVILIGRKTAGQNVMMDVCRSDQYGLTLYPVVAYVADCNGDYNYSSGIETDYEINEFDYVNLEPYGSPAEILFHTALEVMQAP